MRILFQFKLLIYLLLLSFNALAAAEFVYTDESVPTMQEARAFRAVIDGIDIVGADVGPKGGLPVVLVGGFTSSFPYMRKFIRSLNAAGFRVFVYNPPGQGRDQLQSGALSPMEQLGIDGMLKVFPSVRHFAFQSSGGKKVVVIGHSLGGLQVRAGSMGVVFDDNGQAYISQRARALAKEETALIVPLFSMAIFGEEVWQDASRLKVFLLRDFAPLFVECNAVMTCLLPWSLHEKISTTYLAMTQNNLYSGLLGAQDLDNEEFKALGRYILPQRVEKQIRLDMIRWLQTRAFTTESGLDLGEQWRKQQSGVNAIATLFIAGQRDKLLDMQPFSAEAEILKKSNLLVVDAGHIGAFVSQTLPKKMANEIARSYVRAQSCEQILLPAPGAKKIGQ